MAIQHCKHDGKVNPQLFDECDDSATCPTKVGGTHKSRFLSKAKMPLEFGCQPLMSLIKKLHKYWGEYQDARDEGGTAFKEKHEELEKNPKQLLQLFDDTLKEGQDAWNQDGEWLVAERVQVTQGVHVRMTAQPWEKWIVGEIKDMTERSTTLVGGTGNTTTDARQDGLEGILDGTTAVGSGNNDGEPATSKGDTLVAPKAKPVRKAPYKQRSQSHVRAPN
ncbi:hypothetical protein K474DRAFT_137793 [Panus rudis PR-1116 ss-1]|nr:hypothetical protein K474DRAFT_137793 [Panus rudis PR-1116 ss-1]